MKPFTTFVFLCTLCVAVLPQLIVARPTNVTKLVTQVCAHTAHKGLCVDTLAADPISQGANQTGLALVALRVASQNASDITEHIKVSVNDASLAPAVQQGLSDCMDNYVDAAEQLDDSLAALLAGAHDDLNTWVNVAIADSDSCEKSIKGFKTGMSKKNVMFRMLCENALAIAKAVAIAGN